jgi:hypothetical protein
LWFLDKCLFTSTTVPPLAVCLKKFGALPDLIKSDVEAAPTVFSAAVPSKFLIATVFFLAKAI